MAHLKIILHISGKFIITETITTMPG